jgi:hypothetical protein
LRKMKTRKAPKGKPESPWSLHIGSFRKIHFINPPERFQRFRYENPSGLVLVRVIALFNALILDSLASLS